MATEVSKSESIRKLLVCGGGTGGHILAGVALADEWKRKFGVKSEVLFVGARGGLEEKLVPKAGYALELLDMGPLNRVGIARKIKTLLQIPKTLLISFQIIQRFGPEAVVGVGGYASGPVALVAGMFSGIFKCKAAILEQNSVPGMTNRILGRFVSLVFVVFPKMESFFAPNKLKAVGNPVRTTIQRFKKAERNPFVVFIFGGSQGAIGVNSLVLEALPFLKALGGRIRFIHQTGEKDLERVKAGYLNCGIDAQVDAFIYEMAGCYEKASLVICRAGSSTLSEIAAAGRAAIFVPLPTAADNHQVHNALAYVDAGAGVMINQNESKGEDLARMIINLIEHPYALEQMENKVTQFYRPNAARDMIDALQEKI